MREASDTSVFKFLHRTTLAAIAGGGGERQAFAASWLLAHYAVKWESERVKRGRWGGSVAVGLDCGEMGER